MSADLLIGQQPCSRSIPQEVFVCLQCYGPPCLHSETAFCGCLPYYLGTVAMESILSGISRKEIPSWFIIMYRLTFIFITISQYRYKNLKPPHVR